MRCPECGNMDNRLMCGHEVRGVYDGVLYWECMECHRAFPRNHGAPYRNALSVAFANKHNDRRR